MGKLALARQKWGVSSSLTQSRRKLLHCSVRGKYKGGACLLLEEKIMLFEVDPSKLIVVVVGHSPVALVPKSTECYRDVNLILCPVAVSSSG